jgi:transposase InsO family protein
MALGTELVPKNENRSRRGNSWDNAVCESFMKTLKCEEVYRSEYRKLAEARARIGDFLKARDGCTRRSPIVHPPSSGIRVAAQSDGGGDRGGEMSFLRHGEIYPCDGALERPFYRSCRLRPNATSARFGFTLRIRAFDIARELCRLFPNVGTILRMILLPASKLQKWWELASTVVFKGVHR